MDEELIVLLDESGEEIGSAPKLSSHHENTPLHLAFSCYIFDDSGRFLVTRRALSKKVWPGVWTNSVCGHPAPGEEIEDAVARRSLDELGMTIRDLNPVLPHYRYKTPPMNGIIENEICPVFVAKLASTSEINPAEVEEIRWMGWQEYIDDVKKNPDKYSFWAKDQLLQLDGHPLLGPYIS